MQVQLKAVLLIALLAGYEAHRINAQVEIAKHINGLKGFSQKAQQDVATGMESGDWGCNEADVIVQALYKTQAGDQKLNVRVPKDALTEGVEVGRKTKNGCNFVYSLLCGKGLTTLRREKAICGQQSSGCDGCHGAQLQQYSTVPKNASDPTSQKDSTFAFWRMWRTTQQLAGQSLFKFSDDFNSKYANGALEDARKVYFTPTGETCADARNHMAEQKDKLKEVLTGLKDVVDKGDFKARTAMLKPFQKAKMGYDKMGCESTPMMDAGFLEEMVSKLRETFVNARQTDVDEATSRQRFDDTLEFIKGHSSDVSLKDIIKASGIAFHRREVSTDDGEQTVDGSEEVTPEFENMLADKLEEQSTALVQLKEGQGNEGNEVLYFLITTAVIVGIIVLYWVFFWWMVLAGVIISLGLLTFAGVEALLEDRKNRKDGLSSEQSSS